MIPNIGDTVKAKTIEGETVTGRVVAAVHGRERTVIRILTNGRTVNANAKDCEVTQQTWESTL